MKSRHWMLLFIFYAFLVSMLAGWLLLDHAWLVLHSQALGLCALIFAPLVGAAYWQDVQTERRARLDRETEVKRAARKAL